MGVKVVAWQRYGHRRTYVNDDDGTTLGYRDEKTGEVHVSVDARAADVRRALGTPSPKATPDPERARRRQAAAGRTWAQRSWHAPTLSEKALADELVRSSPFGWAREVAWERYRLDFYCAAARLAVEVDGSSHRRRTERDAERDAYFRALGIETVRVAAADVERDCAAVVARLNRTCVARTGSLPPVEVPVPGRLNRLLGRTRAVPRPPLAPAEYAGRRTGGPFVCARCRTERPAAERSRRSAGSCTRCEA
jgi:very-short-patch-repair endonuclease